MTAFFPTSRREFMQRYPLSYATLALVPECSPDLRERIAVITAAGQTLLEVEVLGLNGPTLEGFDFVWVEAHEPEELDFFGNQIGGFSKYPALVHRNITIGMPALTVRLRELGLIPDKATVVALVDPLAPGTADEF